MGNPHKTVQKVAVHAPPHLDELGRLVVRRLFGGVELNFEKVEWLFVTDGGRSFPNDFVGLARKGEALAVGIGGNLSGDDEHGTTVKSAMSLPLPQLRQNFDRVMIANGVPPRFLPEYWDRFMAHVMFCEIRDSSATGAPFDLSTIYKRLVGYRTIFARGTSPEQPVVRGQWTREHMLAALFDVQAALVGITCLPHEPIPAMAGKRIEHWLIGWVLRNLRWSDKPTTTFGGSLEELFGTVNRRRDPITHQMFRFLMEHVREVRDSTSPWRPNVTVEKLLRHSARYDGRRAECPETLLNLVWMFMRREWHEGEQSRDAFVQTLPRQLRDILRLEPGFARQFLCNTLDAWKHDQWLYAIEGARNEKTPGAVTYRETPTHELAVVYDRGPHMATRVRSRQDHRVTMMLVFNTIINTVMVAVNRGMRTQPGGAQMALLAPAARQAGKDAASYADYLTRWWLALLRTCELRQEGREVPVDAHGGPAKSLFAEGALVKEINPDPKWYGAVNSDGHIHTVMSGSISHPDAPRTALLESEQISIPNPEMSFSEVPERFLIALSAAVQDAASADQQEDAFRELFRRILDAPNLSAALLD